jgi:hypothetical protein
LGKQGHTFQEVKYILFSIFLTGKQYEIKYNFMNALITYIMCAMEDVIAIYENVVILAFVS